MFGREVNLASRLEGLSGHSRIIISEATFHQLERDNAALAALCVERMADGRERFPATQSRITR